MSARDELAKHLADLWPVSTGDLREADAILSALKAAEEGYREIPAVAAALEFPANHVVTSEQIVPKIDEWKAELTTLRAENARLKRLLEECANDLAMEIDSRYPNAGQHPSEAKRRDRDMEIVNLARAALNPEPANAVEVPE